MLFGSGAKWWDDYAYRHAPHEGLDIMTFTNAWGQRSDLDTDTQIPVMEKGTIINVCHDFLGQSVIVRHDTTLPSSSMMLSVYSHLSRSLPAEPGSFLKRGDIIGRLADTSLRKSGIPCHLHISIMEVNGDIPADQINWDLMGRPDPAIVRLYDPMAFVTNASADF